MIPIERKCTCRELAKSLIFRVFQQILGYFGEFSVITLNRRVKFPDLFLEFVMNASYAIIPPVGYTPKGLSHSGGFCAESSREVGFAMRTSRSTSESSSGGGLA